MVWPTLESRMAKEQNRTRVLNYTISLSVVIIIRRKNIRINRKKNNCSNNPFNSPLFSRVCQFTKINFVSICSSESIFRFG